MKRILAILLTLSMLFSLAACGGKDDPNAGIYDAVSCTALGFNLDCDGEWLELKGNGKGSICLMGEEYNCKWTLEGETFTLTNHGDEFKGTLHNGIITLDFGDMIYVYIMDETKMEDGTIRGHVHQWKDADCLNPQTCVECNAIEGSAKGHDAKEANHQEASVCKNCGVVLAEKLQPDMEKYGFTEFIEVGVIYPFTTITGKNDSITTTGEVSITSYEVFDSADGYPAKEGYEWRIVTMEAIFFDYNARQYAIDLNTCSEDYYNTKLHDDSITEENEDGFETSLVVYKGARKEAYERYTGEWSGWHWKDGRRQNKLTTKYEYLMPKGYDGRVIGFVNGKNEWVDGSAYVIDFDPAECLLFRLN